MNKAFSPNKKLGQHFLKDQKTIDTIIKSMPTDTSTIVEIGPGTGAITEHLISLNKNLILIEKDKRFVDYWLNRDIKCLACDVLKLDWHDFLKQHLLTNEKIWLVSNLPYNISAPLTVKLLQVENIKHMTLMYQKEVAEKILGTDGMSSLFALSQSYFNVKKVHLVKPGAFNPPPKVDSLVLQFTRKEFSLVTMSEFDRYEKFLRNLFAYPRKQLGSVLSKFMSANWKDTFPHEKIDLTLRAEKLSWDQLFILYSQSLILSKS